MRRWATSGLGSGVALAALSCAATAAGAEAGHAHLGISLPEASVLPFVLLLLSIAILPLVRGHWWEHNRNKALVVGVLMLPVVLFFVPLWQEAPRHEIVDKLREYVSFMMLLGALYVISGGIYVQGSLAGTPVANTSLLGLGAALASFIGTTGASVVLIRPLLRANQTRVRKTHLFVFFIFIVSNCGGLLLPLGDPPLFLGFLKGVPFEWTLLRLWPQWLLVNGLLLVISHVYDEIVFAREELERSGSQLEEVQRHEPLRIRGQHNLLLLLGIVLAIFAAGRGIGNGGSPWPWGPQEAIMLGLALVAYWTTAAELRTANKFTFGPIIEVAVLFIGIFVTMAPALLILNAWGHGDRSVLGLHFGMEHPYQYFWASGGLSSFLDNAPTYLTFAATASGTLGVDVEDSRYLSEFLAKGEHAARLLSAISCGSVFMGANTYIGNGPNFMVKAIAEENGVKMPSFFGYMLYSGAVLIPMFVLVTLVFFRG